MADYPSSYPTFETPGSELSDPEHSSLHEKTDEELSAGLAELGLAPSGSWSTVRARLDNVDARLPSGVATGTHTGSTDGSGSITVTHGLSFTPAVVMIAPQSPNGATTSTRFTQWSVGNVGGMTFNVQRCISQDGTLLASTSVTFRWVAVGSAL